jgi:hypothetical protein
MIKTKMGPTEIKGCHTEEKKGHGRKQRKNFWETYMDGLGCC